MRSLDTLNSQVDKMLNQATSPDNIPDWQVGEMASQDAHDLIMRKLAILTDQALTDEQKEAAYREVDRDIYNRRSEAEHNAIDAFYKRHAGEFAGAKEMLLQKLGVHNENENAELAVSFTEVHNA